MKERSKELLRLEEALIPVSRQPKLGQLGGCGIVARGRLLPNAAEPETYITLTVVSLLYCPFLGLTPYLCRRTPQTRQFIGWLRLPNLAAIVGWPRTILFLLSAFSTTLILTAFVIIAVIYIKLFGPNSVP